MKCERDKCDRLARRNGRYCCTHARYLQSVGLAGFQPAAEVIAHIAKLRELEWTWKAIGDAAGLAESVAYLVFHGTRTQVKAPTRTAILSIPLEPRKFQRKGVDATGTKRRLQALAWMGWPAYVISTRVGLAPASLTRMVYQGRVSREVADKVRALFDELALVEGPSRGAAGIARSRGVPPPLAYDEDTIDDPNAQPQGVKKQRRRSDAETVAEYYHLASLRMSLPEIARALGVSESGLERAIQRVKAAA